MSGTDLEEDLPAAVKSQDSAKARRGIQGWRVLVALLD